MACAGQNQIAGITDVPRTKPTIHIELIENNAEPTESDLRQWVRATQILLRAKARRDTRLAAEIGLVRRTVLTISFRIGEQDASRLAATAA